MKIRSVIVNESRVSLAAAPALAKHPPSRSFSNPVQGDKPFTNCTTKGQILAGRERLALGAAVPPTSDVLVPAGATQACL